MIGHEREYFSYGFMDDERSLDQHTAPPLNILLTPVNVKGRRAAITRGRWVGWRASLPHAQVADLQLSGGFLLQLRGDQAAVAFGRVGLEAHQAAAPLWQHTGQFAQVAGARGEVIQVVPAIDA